MAKKTIPLRQSIPLDPKKIIKKTISGTFTSLIALFFFSWFITLPLVSISWMMQESFSGVFSAVFGLGFFFLLVVVGGMYWYQKAYFRTYFYDMNKDFIIIKKGVFMPVETTLPIEKINDIYVDQDLLDRMFGLYDVHFSTATQMSGLQAHIDGLLQENALKLKNIALAAIKKAFATRKHAN